jgi:hypothetical protein
MRSLRRILLLVSFIGLAWAALPSGWSFALASDSSVIHLNQQNQQFLQAKQTTPEPDSPSNSKLQAATRTPRSTPAPIPTPPPSDPDTTQLIVLFGVLVVLVILLGIWLNRKRIF